MISIFFLSSMACLLSAALMAMEEDLSQLRSRENQIPKYLKCAVGGDGLITWLLMMIGVGVVWLVTYRVLVGLMSMSLSLRNLDSRNAITLISLRLSAMKSKSSQ